MKEISRCKFLGKSALATSIASLAKTIDEGRAMLEAAKRHQRVV
jgi:hypothetical protein